MRLLIWLLFVSAFGSGYSQFIRVRVRRSTDIQPSPADAIAEQVLQQERKERRLLRKKKQRLQQLREEIRLLNAQLRDSEPSIDELHGFQMDAKKTKRRRLQGRDEKWKRKVLEKMKRIVRRLDRMERNLTGTPVNRFRQQSPGKANRENKLVKSVVKQKPVKQQVMMTTSTVLPQITPVLVMSTPAAVKTSITPPNKANDKERMFHSSVAQSRKGDNFTACETHKDCKPGRCCHRMRINSTLQSVCVFHSLPTESICLDSCQCAPTLSCFRPFPIVGDKQEEYITMNATRPAYCKRAETEDIINGDYIFNQNAVFADRKRKR